MTIKNIFTIIFFALLTGCVMMHSSEVTVKNIINEQKGPKVVTFLNNTPYIADMSVALAENGFTVKPMPTQQQIVELQGNTIMAKYNEAVTRWGISLQTKDSGYTCAFTDYNIYHFTLMLTDITNNQVVMVLKQKGSDGPCTTVQPVFGTLSKALSENW
jgi:hypothetical protein